MAVPVSTHSKTAILSNGFIRKLVKFDHHYQQTQLQPDRLHHKIKMICQAKKLRSLAGIQCSMFPLLPVLHSLGEGGSTIDQPCPSTRRWRRRSFGTGAACCVLRCQKGCRANTASARWASLSANVSGMGVRKHHILWG